MGTSKAYVIGLAFVAAGFGSLPIILAVCGLTAVVAYNYIIVCAHFPDGGGVYSAARQQSRFLASDRRPSAHCKFHRHRRLERMGLRSVISVSRATTLRSRRWGWCWPSVCHQLFRTETQRQRFNLAGHSSGAHRWSDRAPETPPTSVYSMRVPNTIIWAIHGSRSSVSFWP